MHMARARCNDSYDEFMIYFIFAFTDKKKYRIWLGILENSIENVENTKRTHDQWSVEYWCQYPLFTSIREEGLRNESMPFIWIMAQISQVCNYT